MIPARLITRVTLDGVAQTYETGILPTDPDTCVLWDALQVSGCEVLASEAEDVKQGSALHRWIVLDAIESAESVPQGTEGNAARTWVADPSEENRVAAAAASFAAYAASYVAAYAASYAAYAAADSAAAAYYAASASDAAFASPYDAYSPYYAAAKLRLRVLETMAQAGVLPEPSVE